jgi:hypothetical protein
MLKSKRPGIGERIIRHSDEATGAGLSGAAMIGQFEMMTQRIGPHSGPYDD